MMSSLPSSHGGCSCIVAVGNIRMTFCVRAEGSDDNPVSREMGFLFPGVSAGIHFTPTVIDRKNRRYRHPEYRVLLTNSQADERGRDSGRHTGIWDRNGAVDNTPIEEGTGDWACLASLEYVAVLESTMPDSEGPRPTQASRE